MLKRYGDNALKESAARANELALAGDDHGAATWRRIMAAVTQLGNKSPPGRVHQWSKSNAGACIRAGLDTIPAFSVLARGVSDG
jgi:hypothetical protein